MATEKTARTTDGSRQLLSAAALIGAVILSGLYVALFRQGPNPGFRFVYTFPAVAAGALLGLERMRHMPKARRMLGWDLLILALGLWRAVSGFLPLSGHALLAAYSLTTSRDRTSQAASIGLLLVTLYTKIVIWHWDVSLWPGLALGALLGWLAVRASRID